MDAIIGRYRARMEKHGLLLKHASGINFDLNLEETLGLLDFINVYRQTLLMLQQQDRETDPQLRRITFNEGDDENY